MAYATVPYVGVEHRRKPQPMFCVSEALASLTHAYMGSFFLHPEDIKSLSLEAVFNLSTGTWLP